MEAVTVVLNAVQAIVVAATAVFAWLSIKKFRDSRGIDFILEDYSQAIL